MSQPNFLQVERSLHNAIAFVNKHPSLLSSKFYKDSLTTSSNRFLQMTKETDLDYRNWRQLLGRQLLAFKSIRLAFSDLWALCDEHAYDIPKRRVLYTEEEEVFKLLDESIAFLEDKKDQWPWIEKMYALLLELKEDAKTRQKQTKRLYQAYTITVKTRVDGYQKAVSLVREYVKDAREDSTHLDGFKDISFDIVKRLG